MKHSATFLLGLAMAPLSMALSVGEPLSYSYWPARRDDHKSSDKEDNKDNNKDNNNNGNNNDGNSIVIDLSNLKDGKKSDGSKTNVIIIWVNPGNNAETTTINEKVTVTQTVTAGVTDAASTVAPAAASHTVTVGGPGGLIYQPDQLNDIPIGDTVIFEFLSQNHTVTQSAFDTPCDPLEAGMDSGFMANPNNTVSPPPQVAMQVMVDTPLWFYCRQANHCGMGMVFSINPTAEKTQAQFQALAIKQKGDGTDTAITNPSATTAAGETAASTTAAAEATESVTPGKGTMGGDGSCTCVAICSSGSFPVAAQGIGAFGGSPGGLPINMAAL